MISILNLKKGTNTPAFKNFIIGVKSSAELFLKLHAPLAILNQVYPPLITPFSSAFRTILASNSFRKIVMLAPFTESLIFRSIPIPITLGSHSFLRLVVLVPIKEELIYRGIIQSSIKKIIHISLKTLRVTNEKKCVKIAYEISRFAASVIFGAAHVYCGSSVFLGVYATLGAYFGQAELMEKVGLAASIGCHMTSNLIVFSIENLL